MPRAAKEQAVGDSSWTYYQEALDPELRALATALDQFADLLADLMAIEGALVLTQNLTAVGFGFEIRAPHVALDQVYRALDLGGAHVQAEPACLAEPSPRTAACS